MMMVEIYHSAGRIGASHLVPSCIISSPPFPRISVVNIFALEARGKLNYGHRRLLEGRSRTNGYG